MEARANERTWVPPSDYQGRGGRSSRDYQPYDRGGGRRQSESYSGGQSPTSVVSNRHSPRSISGNPFDPSVFVNPTPLEYQLHERSSHGYNRHHYHQDREEYSDLYRSERQQRSYDPLGDSRRSPPPQQQQRDHYRSRSPPLKKPGSVSVSGSDYYDSYGTEKYVQDPQKDAVGSFGVSNRGGISNNDSKGRRTIEVSPGQYLPLHGSQETLAAMQERRLAQCYCCICDVDIHCVREASFILCPTCRTVWPMEDQDRNNTSKEWRSGGVGLGITSRNYREWTS